MSSPLTIFARKKREGRKIAMISLYDAPSAEIACEAGVDALLVGDSLGNVVLGHRSTVPVTMDDMLRHTAAVVRGVQASSRPETPVVADLPFGSYANVDSAIRNSVALMQTGAHGVKLEGDFAETVAELRRQGIPVMGHLGFTPQSVHLFEQTVQARRAEHAAQVLGAARHLDDAGCFGIVLEAMSAEVAREISAHIQGATIGIGAGPECDGQILVLHDLVGLSPHKFRFVQRYLDTRELWKQAASAYIEDVGSGSFPAEEHSWRMNPGEAEKLSEQRKEESG